MKKYLTPCLAVLAVVAIVLCFVFNGQKGDLQKNIDSVTEQLKTAEAKVTELEAAKTRDSLSLIEVKCSIGARDDLGRPTTTALENKQNFMKYLR